LPFVAGLNDRFGWFEAPHAYDPVQWGR